MSVKVMSLVWQRASYSSGSLLVLLALADWANDDGICWPSVAKLARKARLDRRSVQRIIRQLADDGVIVIDEGGGRAKQNRYIIQIETVTKCRPLVTTETAASATQRATSDAERATPMPPDPLVEPLDDPSVLRAPRDSDIKKWIPYLLEKKKRGQDVLPEIESVDDKALRRTLLEWAA